MYRVAKPSECLAIISPGEDNILITNQGWISNNETCIVIDMSPIAYHFDFTKLSSDKIPFTLSIDVSIGPNSDDVEKLITYVKRLSGVGYFNWEILKPIFEFAVYEVLDLMSIDDIRALSSEELKNRVKEKVRSELDNNGVMIHTICIIRKLDKKGKKKIQIPVKDVKMKGKKKVDEDELLAETFGKMKMRYDDSFLIKIDAEQKKLNGLLLKKKKEIAEQVQFEQERNSACDDEVNRWQTFAKMEELNMHRQDAQFNDDPALAYNMEHGVVNPLFSITGFPSGPDENLHDE